jgi:hypothetical protein
MSDSLKVIGIKNLKEETFLRLFCRELSVTKGLSENLYISILPPVEDWYFVEFADFIPVSRYNDLDLFNYLSIITKDFKKVCLLEKKDKNIKSVYQKYINGSMETDYTGEGAVEKGVKFDLILDYSDIIVFMKKIRFGKLQENDLKPSVYQLINENKLLDIPEKLDYKEFYG